MNEYGTKPECDYILQHTFIDISGDERSREVALFAKQSEAVVALKVLSLTPPASGAYETWSVIRAYDAVVVDQLSLNLHKRNVREVPKIKNWKKIQSDTEESLRYHVASFLRYLADPELPGGCFELCECFEVCEDEDEDGEGRNEFLVDFIWMPPRSEKKVAIGKVTISCSSAKGCEIVGFNHRPSSQSDNIANKLVAWLDADYVE